jgi:hypothetical protein
MDELYIFHLSCWQPETSKWVCALDPKQTINYTRPKGLGFYRVWVWVILEYLYLPILWYYWCGLWSGRTGGPTCIVYGITCMLLCGTCTSTLYESGDRWRWTSLVPRALFYVVGAVGRQGSWSCGCLKSLRKSVNTSTHFQGPLVTILGSLEIDFQHL